MSEKITQPFQDSHPTDDDLQSYHDLMLDPGLIHAMEEHLESCSSCQAELSKLDALAVRLKALPAIPLDKDFSPGVLAEIRDKAVVPRGLTWTMLVEGLAAGIVVGLIIPALQTAVWIPRLFDTGLEIRAAINIFLTQLASSWMVWWAKLQLNFTLLIKGIDISPASSGIWFSPWLLIIAAAGAGLLLNFILLKSSFQFGKSDPNN